MKKYINIAFVYTVLGIISGVFYREFTKFNNFTSKTTLAFTHLHLIALGGLVFLIVALFSCVSDLTLQKEFKTFMKFYNVGLANMVIMLYVRGIIQVLLIDTNKMMNASISGFAGIAHIIFTIGIVYLFLALRKSKSLFVK